jgi:hypothetical protein
MDVDEDGKGYWRRLSFFRLAEQATNQFLLRNLHVSFRKSRVFLPKLNLHSGPVVGFPRHVSPENPQTQGDSMHVHTLGKQGNGIGSTMVSRSGLSFWLENQSEVTASVELDFASISQTS